MMGVLYKQYWTYTVINNTVNIFIKIVPYIYIYIFNVHIYILERSLEHTLVGDQTSETSRQSFAGTFASLGISNNLEEPSDEPVCVVSYDGPLFNDKENEKEKSKKGIDNLAPTVVKSSQMSTLLDRIVEITEDDDKEVDEVIWLHSLKGTSIGTLSLSSHAFLHMF